MKINSVSGITYHVRDLARSAEFYESLGFRKGAEEPDRVTFWSNWFFLTLIAAKQRKGANGAGAFTYVKVDDLDAYHEAVVAKGLSPEDEPHATNGGRREFVLRDPDGYNLVFFEKK